MTGRTRIRVAVGLACWFGVLTPALRGESPTYVKRLQLPVLRDGVSYGHSVTVDPHTSEILVSDPRSNRILIFDENGYFSFQVLGGEDIGAPQDIAVDPDGLQLVIATRGDQRLALELDFDGAFRREIPLVGADEEILLPRFTSLALSWDGSRLFLVDDANDLLWITDRDGRVLRSVDPLPDLEGPRRRDAVLGHVDVYGDRVVLAVPSEGEILIFDLDGDRVARVGAKGTGGCQLGRPTAAALTGDGRILVIDQQRMLLSNWSIEGNRCLGEYIGIGSLPGYLYFPFDLALDAEGRVYIGQSWDGRVQVFEGMGAAPAIADMP